jgi:hypothetical protein
MEVRQSDAALVVRGDLADVVANRRSDSIRSVAMTLPPRQTRALPRTIRPSVTKAPAMTVFLPTRKTWRTSAPTLHHLHDLGLEEAP